MINSSMIGSICAFAGQISPVSGDPNNVWASSGCASVNAVTAKTNNKVPLVHPESQGWMLCDGRALHEDAYAELFAVLGHLYGDPGNNQFLIPDCRGLFLRGVDGGAGMDPDTAKRLGPDGTGTSDGIGSLQCDAMQKHTHTYKAVSLSGISQQGNTAGQAAQDQATTTQDAPARCAENETRAKNIAVNYLIRFR